MVAALKQLLPRHRDQLVVVLAKPVLGGFFMRSFVERWLRKLKIEQVSVLLLQSIVSKPPPPRLIERAMALKEEGKVRYISMSSHNRPLLGRIACGELDVPVDLLQLRYNAVHRGAEMDIFPHLADVPAERPGTVCFTATCWSKLLKAKNMPPGEQPLTAAECYRFVLQQPKIDVCVTGPANAEQLEENLAALEDGPLSDEELSRIKRIGDHIYGKKR